MDLIEYANKFIELEFLIRAVYGGTEKGIYIENWVDFDRYIVHADIPNWFEWGAAIYKLSENPKRYVPRAIERLGVIGDKNLEFSFWLHYYDRKYRVDGFEYE